MLQRRKFLKRVGLASAGLLIPVGLNSCVAQTDAQTNNPHRLVVIFLRGAIDGLNIVIPHQETNYYESRPTVAIPYPQEKDGAIDLDGFFGLHPQLEDLIHLWDSKSLAFIHASGLPNIERSHFQAQDYMENGTPGIKKTADGWMNRLLAELPQRRPVQALNVGGTTPYILKGKMEIATLKPGKDSTKSIITDRNLVSQAFGSLYSGQDDLSQAYQTGTKSRKVILEELNQEMMSSARGASNANAFVDDAAEVAKLMVGNTRTQLAFMEVGGWDTHINQTSIHNNLLPYLGKGIATLVKGLEPIYADTTIVVLSEFGRTVKENGNKGTDHGHGNVMFLLGGKIRGGKVYREWNGLEESALDEQRDLPVTTDFRLPIASILQNRMGLAQASLNRVFPDYQARKTLDFLV